ncbi:MAG: hypothetical protein AAGK71_05225 [Pseudomonadota bacterium]
MTPKIATCCYCGTRAALTLRGKERHELACSNCGAPLHEMKMFRRDMDSERDVRGTPPKRQEVRYDTKRRKKKKKTKSLSRRFMEEVFDVAEDLFDVFD